PTTITELYTFPTRRSSDLSAPDDLDWEDEIRQALESRAAQSPDALTGLEANLRFGPSETPETRIFGRLSAWQNWIFIRPKMRVRSEEHTSELQSQSNLVCR